MAVPPGSVFGVFQKKPATTGYVNAFMHTPHLISNSNSQVTCEGYPMPKPIARFLHTFKSAKTINVIGAGAITTSLAALGAVSAAGAMAGALTTAAVIVGTGGLALLTLPTVYAIARATFWRKDRQKIANEKKPLTNN